jgi:hypothetical protein
MQCKMAEEAGQEGRLARFDFWDGVNCDRRTPRELAPLLKLFPAGTVLFTHQRNHYSPNDGNLQWNVIAVAKQSLSLPEWRESREGVRKLLDMVDRGERCGLFVADASEQHARLDLWEKGYEWKRGRCMGSFADLRVALG